MENWIHLGKTSTKLSLPLVCALWKTKVTLLPFSLQKKGTKDPRCLRGDPFYFWANGRLPTAAHLGYEQKTAASALRSHGPPLFGPVKLEALLFRARNALKKRRSLRATLPKISPWSMDAVQMEAGLKTRVVQLLGHLRLDLLWGFKPSMNQHLLQANKQLRMFLVKL